MESMLSVIPLVDEFLINDGGSTDGTLEALQRLQKTFPNRVELFHIPDRKCVRWDVVSDVLNFLTGAAKGYWVFQSQGDEVIHENNILKFREMILREPVDHTKIDVIRQPRREVTHHWSKLSEGAYWPARTARRAVEGLHQNWNTYGGDEYLDKDGHIQFHKDGVNRVARYDILIWHLYVVFPGNYINKWKNDAEWLAPGDRHRTAIYEKVRGNKYRRPPPTNVVEGLPALVKGLTQMHEYRVREELFDVDWLTEITGLDYRCLV